MTIEPLLKINSDSGIPANPIEPSYPGVSLDVLGVKPGMSLDAARKVLIANYHSKPTSQSGQLSLTYKSVNMTSQPFVTSLTVSDKQGGSMTVYFGTSATGNKVVEVDRVLVFPDPKSAPTVAAVRAALDKKYGPETKTELDEYEDWLFWSFGKTGHASSCSKKRQCDFANGAPQCSGSTYAIYNKEMSSGDYVYIQVGLSKSGQDTSRSSKLTIFLSDQADKYISCNAASKQIHAAAVAAYKKESTPGAVPKL